ncbi:MAG: c-type cytochrome [Gammaproteobacteria bacterium]|nr:c-type cytochrome [Gammaproteobacteria bacterium]
MKKRFIFVSLLLLTSNTLYALEPPDLDNGEEINETCAGCHGEYAEGGKDGEYPRLAGLPADYIVNQLRLFRDQKRPNIPMLEYLNKGQLPDQEKIDVAAFLQSIQLTKKLPPIIEGDDFDAYERMMLTKRFLNIAKIEGDTKKGKKLYKRECKSCHGKNGEGDIEKSVPMLAGQYTKYLKKQIILFIEKKRIHDQDAPEEELLADFSTEELNNIFAYLSVADDE